MKSMNYFVLSSTEDGMTISILNKESLETRLAEKYWGEDIEIFTSAPDKDPMYWPAGLLIIKGEVIVPKAVEVVTKFEV